MLRCQIHSAISFSKGYFKWSKFLLQFTLQRSKDSSHLAIKSLEQPLHPQLLPTPILFCPPGITVCWWGGAWQFGNSNASDPIASLRSGCHIRSNTVWDYPSGGTSSFSVVSRCRWTDSHSLGRWEAHRCQREICFGLTVMMPHLHTLHAAPRISSRALKQQRQNCCKVFSFWGRRSRNLLITTGRGRNFVNYFSKKMESLRALPKVESENLFGTEQNKRLHTVLKMKPSVTLFLQIWNAQSLRFLWLL